METKTKDQTNPFVRGCEQSLKTLYLQTNENNYIRNMLICTWCLSLMSSAYEMRWQCEEL